MTSGHISYSTENPAAFVQAVDYFPPYAGNWKGTHIKPHEQVVRVKLRDQGDVKSNLRDFHTMLRKKKMRTYIEPQEGQSLLHIVFEQAGDTSASSAMLALHSFIAAGEHSRYVDFLKKIGITEDQLPSPPVSQRVT